MLNSSWEPLFLEPSKIRKRWCLLSLNRFCHFALQSNLDPRIYIICEYQFQVSNSKYYRAKKKLLKYHLSLWCWNMPVIFWDVRSNSNNTPNPNQQKSSELFFLLLSTSACFHNTDISLYAGTDVFVTICTEISKHYSKAAIYSWLTVSHL